MVSFQTKAQLARVMLERAVGSGVPFGWFTGDEVYGNDRNLRQWLERRDVPHVLAIKRSEKLWALTEKGPSKGERTGWHRRLMHRDGSGAAPETVPKGPGI